MVSGGAADHAAPSHYRPRFPLPRGADAGDALRGAAPDHRVPLGRAGRERAGGAIPWRPSVAADRGGAAAGRRCGVATLSAGS